MNFTISAIGLPEILQDLDGWKDVFDLTRIDIALKLLDTATFEILASMDAEADPDGIPWPDLSATYAEWKHATVGDKPIGVLYGHMKTREQVAGERTITATFASMTYGIDAIAKAECDKFTMGGLVTGTNQPPREFFGLTIQAITRCDELLDNIFHGQ